MRVGTEHTVYEESVPRVNSLRVGVQDVNGNNPKPAENIMSLALSDIYGMQGASFCGDLGRLKRVRQHSLATVRIGIHLG